MNLNKEICKRCISSSIMHAWDDSDEKRWSQRQEVWCPGWGNKISDIYDIDNVPEFCNYKLEHIVVNDEV